MYIATDLHSHSRFSDARLTPEALVEERARAGLQVIALSDHDVLAGVRRAARAAAERGLQLIPAMEVTSFVGFGSRDAEQWHVLAYYPPAVLEGDRLERLQLYQRGLRVQARWRSFVLGWVADLPRDQRLLFADLESLSAAEFPGLVLLLDRMRAGCDDLVMPFIRHHVRFWTEDRELFGWSPEELIDAIRADGAVDVVAHPARYRDKERLARLLLGASGVEVYTSRHRPEWAEGFRAFAERYGKLWTASTDDHQVKPYAPPPCGTPRWVVEQLLGAAAPHASRAA